MKAGTIMYWNSGTPAYQKMDDEDFGVWKSLEVDLDKPLEKRYGWKWTDSQVLEYYSPIAYFHNEDEKRIHLCRLRSKYM